MELYLLYKVDPYSSSNIPNTYLFKNKKNAYEFVLEEINNMLEGQNNYVCGLKGDKNSHLCKYKNFLEENSMLYYYGEYQNYYETLEPYEYKYKIEQKTII